MKVTGMNSLLNLDALQYFALQINTGYTCVMTDTSSASNMKA